MQNPLVIIQARTGSSRLPNKMTKNFYNGKSLLELLLARLTSVIDPNDIVVATTIHPKDDAIIEICDKSGIRSFRGSEEDVLLRFIEAAESMRRERLIRVCGDNLFLDLEFISQIYELGKTTQKDYISFQTSLKKPSILTHYGFWTEYVSLDALKRAYKEATDKIYHEHVTNYIHGYPDKFHCQFLEIPKYIESHSNLRLTLDTERDFEIQSVIYKDLTENNIPISPENLIRYLDQRPFIYKEMGEIIEGNRK